MVASTGSRDVVRRMDSAWEMKQAKAEGALRVLVVDDNRAIHEDFRRILGEDSEHSAKLGALENALFSTAIPGRTSNLEIDSAY